MTAFFELTPQFKKLKRSASLEFCVHLDMSQIGIVCFTKHTSKVCSNLNTFEFARYIAAAVLVEL